jgi:NADPH-dependent curcumin reductase CurA
MADPARRVVLVSRPVGEPTPENFRTEDFPVPTPGPGQVLLRTLWLSLDPYMRGRMSEAPSYAAPVGIGGTMVGGTVSEVIASNNPDFAAGDLVLAPTGWQTHAVSDGKGLRKIDPKLAPLSTALGILGMPGMTAYAGLLEIGKPQPGETVVVAAASGPVGSMVGQIAKIKGCRAVGIAGGREKADWLVRELGFDAAVDYKAGPAFKALKEAAPQGVDVYFDNVGGDILEACLPQMNVRGRIVCCGAISAYDGAPPAAGPRGIPGLIVVKRLRMEGFIVTDFFGERDKAVADLQAWVRDGKLKVEEDVVEGLENAPQGLIGLLAGENRGKRMVKVG